MPESIRAQATFRPLGLFGGTGSEATDVAADGSVVAGFLVDARTSTVSNFRWRATDESAVRPPGIYGDSPALSGDASIVVGSYQTFGLGRQAFRWAADESFEGLGDLPGGIFDSSAFDASTDGTFVVGAGYSAMDFEAFRWTRQSGMVGLGDLPGGITRSAAFGVSADGAVVVGEAHATGRPQAFRWTAETGMVGLGFLPGAIHSIARRVSADGSVVIGVNNFPPPPLTTHSEAFRWTQHDGMTTLGDLPGGRTASIAYDVSADGSVVVGGGVGVSSEGREVFQAFYWTAESGIVNLQDLLVSAGATNLDGWALTRARGVSADGLTIVGTGAHDGVVEAWVATIPEPSTLAFAASGAAAFLGFYVRAIRRRKQGGLMGDCGN